MTSIRDAGISSSAEFGQPASQLTDQTLGGEPLSRLFALLPSSRHLEAVASGAGAASNIPAGPKASQRAATVDVSQALLSPLESLPPFVALDAVCRRTVAAKTAAD